jgi:hypothetical protein
MPGAEPPMEGAPPEMGAVPAPAPMAAPAGVIRTGTIEAETYDPTNLILDPEAQTHRVRWLITRKYTNRWDVATRYAKNDPALFKKITEMTRPKDEKLRLDVNIVTKDGASCSDEIPVFTFWHQKTHACPNGKRVVFLNAQTILHVSDLGDLPDIPVRRIAPANIRGTPFGYSEAWDLIAPQRACDILTSISLTNMKTFGVGSLVAPKGSGIKATDVTEGLKLLEFNQTGNDSKPSVLAMPQTPQTVWQGHESWVKQMGTLIGVNGVTRGDPEKSLESGSALALVVAQSVQFVSDFSEEVLNFQRKRATDTIRLVIINLKSEAEFAVLGDSVSPMEKFSGQGIKNVLRVDIKAVNPMAKTIQGRFQLGTFLAERYPQTVTPQQVMHMIENGTLDPITEDSNAEERNLMRENELLAKGIGPPPKVPKMDPLTGKPMLDPMTLQPMTERKAEPGKQYVRALLTDNPMKHAQKHVALLSSPAARQNPKVYTAVLDHLEEHEEQYAFITSQRPGLLQMMNIPPMQAALPMPMPGEVSDKPPGKGAGGGPGKEPPKGGVRPPPEGASTPPEGGGAAKMPVMPKNPSNGERYQPPQPTGE